MLFRSGGLVLPKSIELFEKYGILTKKELESRAEIRYENYSKTINIEALTMLDMVGREILPASMEYQASLADGIGKLANVGVDSPIQKSILADMNVNVSEMYQLVNALSDCLEENSKISCAKAKAEHYRNSVFLTMEKLRAICDRCETLVPSNIWPIPTYADMMYK